jgi:putative ABC transport system permease protein
MIFKLIYRELRSSPRFLIFFVLNLSIGLMGLTSIELFKSTFTQELEEKSKSILGSDLSISSRIKFTDEQIAIINNNVPNGSATVNNISLFSMARTLEDEKKRSKLVNIRVIEKEFPFYGKIILENEKQLPEVKANNIYVYPELKFQLGLKIGSLISIGENNYKVAGFIADDGQQSMMFGSLAPRIYMSKEGLDKANLIKQGSTAWRSMHFRFESDDYEAERENIIAKLNDPSIQVNTAKTSSRQVGRILTYLNDFLGLVSLAGLFLAGMGMIYLFRSFLHQRRKEIAIFKFLGVKKNKVFQIYFGELFILGILGSLLGVIFGLGLLPLLKDGINTALETKVQLSIQPLSLLITFLIGIISTVIMAPALISPYIRIDHKIIFSHDDDIKRTKKELFLFVPMILFYWLMAIYLSKSVLIGSIFISIFIIFISMAFPIGGKILKLLSSRGRNLKLAPKLAFKYITRQRTSTLFVFSCMVISTFLITLIPQIKTILENEIKTPTSINGPSFFLVDIQPEQINSLSSFIKTSNMNMLNLSPMVRARLIKINDKDVKTDVTEGLTREQEHEIRMRNRGVNLSYRSNLDKSEMIIEGRAPKNEYNFEKDSYAEVTLERRYAKRLKVWIGDTLEFDVLGLPVPTKVVGIRDVKWTSFMPNFFISFGLGVLENAPKTYLAAISNPNNLDPGKFQSNFSEKFGNISIVNVNRLVTKISSVIDSMGKILFAMAILVLFVGLLVIYSLITHQIYMRTKDLSLFKMLGMKLKHIRNSLILEMIFISSIAIIIGLSLSTFISYSLSLKMFAMKFHINFYESVGISLIIFVFSITLSYLGTKKVLGRKPSDVFAEVD